MVHAPEGLVVQVFPNKLVFAEVLKSMSYEVSFYEKEDHGGYNFGSITWLDGRHYMFIQYLKSMSNNLAHTNI